MKEANKKYFYLMNFGAMNSLEQKLKDQRITKQGKDSSKKEHGNAASNQILLASESIFLVKKPYINENNAI